MALQRSPTPKANRDVGSERYQVALEHFLLAQPHLEARVRLGPVLATSDRQVTPQGIVAAEKFLSSIIDAGCNNGKLQRVKLEAACHYVLNKHAFLRGKWGVKEAAVAISRHLLQVVHVLRTFAEESQKPGHGGVRKYPRTGSLRRRMSDHDHNVIESLAKRLTCTGSSTDSLWDDDGGGEDDGDDGNDGDAQSAASDWPDLFIDEMRA